MMRLVPLFLAFVALAACGPQQPVKCQPSNCSGCCADDGQCLGAPAQSRNACGGSGQACRACLPDQLCSSNQCVRNPDASVIIDDAGTQPVPDAGRPDSGATCGGLGLPCCNGNMCNLALACDRGLCQVPPADSGVVCGGLNQACCANQLCTAVGTTCNGGTCTAPVDAGVTMLPTGEPCTADGQCLDGACLQIGFLGGYCTKSCTTSSECVAGSQCGINPTGVGPTRVCFRQCSQAGQAPGGCRTSYVCEANGGTSGVPVCYPACQSVVSCGTAPTCDSRGFCCGAPGFVCCGGTTCSTGTCTSGSCQPTVACGNAGQMCCTTGPQCLGQTVCQTNQCVACGGLGQPCCASNVCSSGTCQAGTCEASTAQPLGGPCSTLQDCQTNSCIQQAGTLWSGGYCTQTCDEATPSSCPSGSTCSRYAVPQNFLCLKNCAWDGGRGDCRTSYVCDRGLIAGSTQSTCVFACTGSGDCGGLACQNGFCCGATGFRCCAGNTCPNGGTCGSLGYCQ